MSANMARQHANSANMVETIVHQIAATQPIGRGWIFRANSKRKIRALFAKWHTAASTGAASVYVVRAADDGSAMTGGELLGSFDLTGTADTENELDLSGVAAASLLLDVGDWIAVEITATPTNMQGSNICIELEWLPE